MKYFYNQHEVTPRELMPGVKFRLIWGERIMMGIVDIEANTTVPLHSHRHEQCGRILHGGAWFTVGTETALPKRRRPLRDTKWNGAQCEDRRYSLRSSRYLVAYTRGLSSLTSATIFPTR